MVAIGQMSDIYMKILEDIMLVFLMVMALIAILIITGEVIFLKVLQEIRIETTEIKTQIREILTKELLDLSFI